MSRRNDAHERADAPVFERNVLQTRYERTQKPAGRFLTHAKTLVSAAP